jgi:V-type H+-transporting ATPase subunit F
VDRLADTDLSKRISGQKVPIFEEFRGGKKKREGTRAKTNSEKSPAALCWGEERDKKRRKTMAKAGIRTREDGYAFGIIGDEDTITGFLLAGVGEVDAKRRKNFFVVTAKTPVSQIELAFKEMIVRDDIGALLITQTVANEIRHLLNDFTSLLPTILEIPSKDSAYDPETDSVMQRVMKMTGES